MTESRQNCKSEKPQSQVDVGFGADEEEPGDEERWNVLQVVQMRSSDSLDVFVFLNRNVFAVSDVFGIVVSLSRQAIDKSAESFKFTYALAEPMSSRQQRHQQHLDNQKSTVRNVPAEHDVVIIQSVNYGHFKEFLFYSTKFHRETETPFRLQRQSDHN